MSAPVSPAGPPAPLRRLIVGVDGSANSAAALLWAATLAAQVGAELTALHAVGLLEHMRHEDSRAELEGWCAPAEDLTPVRRLLRDGPPAAALLAAAEELDADLVVVGSRGIGGAPETRLGSTSLQLLERSRRPVTVLP